MDPNTNIPNNPDPVDPITSSIPPQDPLPVTSVQPDAYEPITPSSLPPSPPEVVPSEPQPVSEVTTPNPITPLPASDLSLNPQVISPAPSAPVVVSGGFESSVPSAPVVGNVDPTYQPSSAMPPVSPSPKKRLLKPLLIALVAIVVLAGGSAAAYFGYILPNQPDNVLMSAIVNSLQQNQIGYTGTALATYQGSSSSSSSQSFKLTIDGSENSTAKASDTTLGLDVYGVKLNVEARLVNKNIYIKAGDLSQIATLLGSLSPSLTTPSTTISKELSNQWIAIDQTLINQAGLGCTLNSSLSVNQADVNILKSAYLNTEFIKVQQTSSDSVNSQAAEKYVVNIDDNKAATFISKLGDLSAVKSLDSCQAGAAKGLTKAKGDNKQTAMTFWVSKSDKRIVRINWVPSKAQLAAANTTAGSFDLNLNYKNVSIAAPANSVPAVQVIVQLQKALSGSGIDVNSLLSGLTGGSTSSLQ